jgi:L-lysine 2,3-aminomutase
MDEVHETSLDISPGLAYIAEHPEIDNVLFTGGDPLLIAPKRLAEMFAQVFAIPHVRVLRLGSKIPAFDPMRISETPELLEAIRRHSRGERQIYVMTHFNHPREITPEAVAALDALREAGAIMCIQTPLLEGVNDDAGVLAKMMNRLSRLGAAPYYLFQGRPTAGNEEFAVPLRTGYRIFEQAKKRMSGLARRLRYVMSHSAGKVEIFGLTRDEVFLKFHQARDESNLGKVFVLPMREDAVWLDDLLEHPQARERLRRFHVKVAPTGRDWEEWSAPATRTDGRGAEDPRPTAAPLYRRMR